MWKLNGGKEIRSHKPNMLALARTQAHQLNIKMKWQRNILAANGPRFHRVEDEFFIKIELRLSSFDAFKEEDLKKKERKQPRIRIYQESTKKNHVKLWCVAMKLDELTNSLKIILKIKS